MIEAVVPILDRYIMRLRSTKIREFFPSAVRKGLANAQ